MELKSRRVLVVDDSPLQRQHAIELLQQLGIDSVLQAGDGIEALEVMAAASYAPDMMLLDLEMPGMDGIELLQQIMQRNLRLDVVVVSSRENALLNTVEVMSRTLGIAILGALQKPLTLDRLAGVLGEHTPALSVKGVVDTMPLEVIARAIEADEFICHYQPKVALATGLVKSVEALARWQHPKEGMIYPDRFVPVLERHGAILQRFSLRIVEQVLKQLQQWHAGGLSLTASVNLSAQSFADSRFAEQIMQRVDASGVDPKHLIIEVTETSIMTDVGASLGTLARLRLKGFGLSIDDYGTGFATMQHLSHIPATELKIDRMFVHGSHQREHMVVMLESAVQMAAKMNLAVVAEGVELMADWQVLKRIGCELAQGYLIAKPMPADQLLPWLKAEQKRLRELATGHH